MFEEALEEHAPGGGDPGCAAFTPARGSSGRTCHRYPNADVITEKHTRVVTRSEEHTSELQSLMRNSYADFCLTQTKTIQNSWNHPQHLLEETCTNIYMYTMKRTRYS